MDQKTHEDLLREMLKIYSPSGKEGNLASFLLTEFGNRGFEKVRRDRVGNIYGEVGSGSPSILLCGHMDTVSGMTPVKTDTIRLYGRGAVDAKSSLAAMICAASCLKLDDGKGRVIVAGIIEEEREAKGIRNLINEGLEVDCAIFGEPSGVRNITFAYKGKLGLRITCETVSRHVGAQHLVDNAIEKSFELWSKLKALCEEHMSPHGIFYSLTPCLTKVSSHRTSGGVPDISVLDIDLRLPPTLKSERAAALVKKVADDFQKVNHQLSVLIKVTDKVEPFIAKRDTFLMTVLKKSISEVIGGSVELLRKTGTGDMNIYGSEKCLPVATYGPGDASLSHTRHEYIDLSDYHASIQILKKTVEKIFLIKEV